MVLKSNEKGLTLIELLASLLLISMISILLWSIFIQGNSSYQDTMDKAKHNQEAQIILETLRECYFTEQTCLVEVKEKALLLNEQTLSEGFYYTLHLNERNIMKEKVSTDASLEVDLVVKQEDQEYHVRTVFEKWN